MSDRLRREVDVAIVGSGAGGGTVAARLAPLAAAGLRVAVFEAGPKLREEEYTGRELEMARRLYVDAGGKLTRDRTMTLAFGRAYGGSTVVYTGTSLTLPEEVVERWAVPGLDHDDLLARSRRYLAENSVHLLPEELLNDNNRLFAEGCRRLGWRCEQFPVNLSGCRGSGLCNLGCPNAAKQGTLRVQLPAAEAAGVETVTNAVVSRIGEDRTLDVDVVSRPFGEPSWWEPGRYRVSARRIVVAGGAVGSPALLLRSGFGERLPALGRYLTLHPALILVGRHPRAITNDVGHPKSFYCDEFAEDERFLLETCMYFPFTTSKNLIGFGPEHAELMSDMRRLQMILVLAIDEAEAGNRVVVDRDGAVVVDYTLAPATLDALHRAMIASARLFFAAGAEEVHAPAGRTFTIRRADADRLEELVPRSGVVPGRISIASAHLMGGCRMGEGPGASVTDSRGRVHGTPWLWVADASLFPRAAEINPYVTVMALADRAADDVLDSLDGAAAGGAVA